MQLRFRRPVEEERDLRMPVILTNEQYHVHRGRYDALLWLDALKGSRKGRICIP